MRIYLFVIPFIDLQFKEINIQIQELYKKIIFCYS